VSQVETFEVAVVGGGPAGCAAALALRRLGVQGVLVVEAGSYEGPRIGETVPPEIRLLLDRLGLGPDFLADGHEPCPGSCSVWGSGEPGYNDFLLNPHGTGWHLDRRRFDARLAHAAAAAGAELWERARFDAVESVGTRDDGGFTLRLSGAGGPRRVRARFVVDATGSRARFARGVGATARRHDRLAYVAAFLDLPDRSCGEPMSRLTLLEAVEYGWWYAARLPGGRATAAVATDPEILRRETLHREEVFRARLAETRLLREQLGSARPSGEPLVVRAAPSFRLDPPGGDDWLAVGDAASSYDPLASQGIHKALLDGLEAAEAIAGRLSGEAGGLDAYRSAVAARFEDYLAVRDHLYRLERRWPAAPFWVRRRARTAAG
jgi:flavin-dependent dehydrogenase